MYPPAQREAIREVLDTVTDHETLVARPQASVAFARRQIVIGSVMSGNDPQVLRHRVTPGDLLIACSDGVHDNLARAEISALIAEHREHGPQAVADALAAAARERSLNALHVRAKDDDITCVALPV